jgi:mannose-1-phosphate guanylyltransferase/mannose-6-phosphate isomerase
MGVGFWGVPAQLRFEANMTVIVPAIMSGGSGTRLWPLSTDSRPKQFHALGGRKTLFRETLERLCGRVGEVTFAPPIIIGNAGQAQLIEQEMDDSGIAPGAILLEPEGRHTAAAAATAAGLAQELYPGAQVFLVPADHVIGQIEAFRQRIATGARYALQRIVTFGVTPDRAETGYGYIESGEGLGDDVMAIASFKEKPDAAAAADYVASGRYFWNGGMFLFAPEVMLGEFSAASDIRDDALAALASARRDGPRIWLGPEFSKVRSVAVDIAVMQTTRLGAVVPCSVGWADVGSWDELWRLEAQGPNDNVATGNVILEDCRGSLVRAEGVTVAAMGLEGFIVVATPNAVLILPKDRAQDVKRLREAALALSPR